MKCLDYENRKDIRIVAFDILLSIVFAWGSTRKQYEADILLLFRYSLDPRKLISQNYNKKISQIKEYINIDEYKM